MASKKQLFHLALAACLIWPAACLVWPAASFAQDVIFKSDGGRLRGKIVKETSKGVRIKTSGGTIFVPRDDIAKIQKDGDVFREFSGRKRKLKDHDDRGWYRLGVWAQGQELYPQAIDCFHEVVRIEPDHEEARWELGYRRSARSGKWLTESDYYEEKGYKRWEDRWVPPDEYSKYAAGMEKVDGRWLTPAEVERRNRSGALAKAPRSGRKAKAPRPKGGGAVAKGPRRQQARWFGGGRALGGQVGLPPLSEEQREAQLAQAKQQGRWSVGHSSKYYDVYSNGAEGDVKKLAKVMDVMCDEYKRIFKFDQDITRPFPVQLYASQREFMNRTGKGAGVGGFYDGHKIVGFHGKLGGLTTQSVLFHEGTHQFQGLVLGRNMWRAKIWLIEGLAVYFEACKVQGRRLNVEIPRSRLGSVSRAIRSGTYVPLATLIRMEQAQFGALHYAHAWSLIHFLVNGAKGGKKRFIEYWEKTKQGGHDGVQLFEDIFDKPMSEIEAAWKDYVLNRLGQRK